MADSTQTIYTQNTNTQTPDPASLAYRNATLPLVTAAATTQPNIYGMKFIPAELDEKGFPKAGTGIYVRDPSVPLTAGPSNDDIEAANARVRATSVTPYLEAAGKGIGAGGATDISGAGRGLYQTAANAPIYGGLPAVIQGQGLLAQSASGNSAAAGQGQYNAATGLYEKAANTDATGAFAPYAGQASGLYGASTAPTGLSAASPFLAAASGKTPDQIAAYMNPYSDAVVNRIATLGARNLKENILPQISDNFVSSGQWGSQRQGELSDRALRDTQEAILAQQAQALEQGYTTAGQQYATDAARQAGLAGTAGGLGTAQQQALQGAAAGLGSLGSTAGNLTTAEGNLGLGAASGIQGIGASNIQASQADLARQIQAATGLNTSGMTVAQMAQMVAQLQQASAQGLTGAAAADAANKISAGIANQNLASTGQNLSLQAAGAQRAIGEDARARGDLSIAADQAATNNAQGALLNNLTAGAGAASATPGSVVLNQSSGSQTLPPSNTLGQLAGAAGTIISGINLAKKAKGGPVRKGSLAKASYGNIPRRGLGMFARAG